VAGTAVPESSFTSTLDVVTDAGSSASSNDAVTFESTGKSVAPGAGVRAVMLGGVASGAASRFMSAWTSACNSDRL
jgi:hypothetical protein